MPRTPIRLTARLCALLLGLTSLGTSALAQSTPPTTTPAPAPAVSGATTKAASAIAVEVSAAIKGQIISCPKTLKVSARGVCLYAKSAPTALRPLIKGRLAGRTVGEWKTSGQTSTLLVAESAGGPLGAYLLLSRISDTESLVVVDAVQASTATVSRAALPAGVVKGQPYLLGSDLVGLVKVTSLGGGKFVLSTEDQPSLTVQVGKTAAQTADGSVTLPLAPASDGKNLIFPVSGLRALGCTVTPAGKTLTVSCGPDSVGLKPIVF